MNNLVTDLIGRAVIYKHAPPTHQKYVGTTGQIRAVWLDQSRPHYGTLYVAVVLINGVYVEGRLTAFEEF